MSIRKLIGVSLLIAPYATLLFILILSLLAPILEFLRLEISRVPYDILHNICNQVPTRCLWFYTSNVALCIRCFFIYLSLFIVGIILIKRKTKRVYWKVGLILMIPCIIDGSTQYLTLRLSNNILRSITGALAGIGIALIFFSLLFRFVNLITERR